MSVFLRVFAYILHIITIDDWFARYLSGLGNVTQAVYLKFGKIVENKPSKRREALDSSSGRGFY